MKNSIIVLIPCIFFFTCNRVNSSSAFTDNNLYGKWNWIKTEGGDVALQRYAPPPHIELIFYNGNYCELFKDDTLISTRKITLTQDTVLYALDTQNILFFTDIKSDTTKNKWTELHSPIFGKFIYSINDTKDTLTISEMWCHYSYKKVQ
jgi:hypothetical protein